MKLCTVYPRACGGTMAGHVGALPLLGLSPRLRGNHGRLRGRAAPIGSIPAPAGEPLTRTETGRTSRVYPRACGGTVGSLSSSTSIWGLSPRLRGNRRIPAIRGQPDGSIPAPAGEPLDGLPVPGSTTVYPRACGGTLVGVGVPVHQLGLSPRLRGNLASGQHSHALVWSIPAPAGEPQSESPSISLTGLSPRLRGNPSLDARSCCP